MANKRKRFLEEFDPNKSDPEDENFDPTEERPRRSSKKVRSSRGSRPPKKRGHRYRGSDIDEDDEELSDSLGEESFDEGSEEDEDAPVNAAGRRTRKVARTHQNYAESSGDEEADVVGDSEDAGEGDDEPAKAEPEDEDDDAPEEPTRKLVKLKVPKGMAEVVTRRSTRASTADAEELVELSASGRHAVASRDSRSRSPEAYSRERRRSRATKGVKTAPEPIDEATQESGSKATHDPDEPDELSHEYNPPEKAEDVDEELGDVVEKDQGDDTSHGAGVEKVEESALAGGASDDDDEEDEDDIPVTRRTRSRAAATGEGENAQEQDEGAQEEAKSRRLTRGSRSKKSTQEPSSDFDPGDDDSDDDGASKAEDHDLNSPTPRGRNGRSRRSSRRGGNSGEDEPDFDLDELNEEARELRQASRPRRRREESPIIYQESRRARARVNYYMPPLTAANIEEEELQDPAPTPARRKGRSSGLGWERNLNTTFGPFGGGGSGGSILTGPWGTGAAGGADSDSSDDEMVHRSSVAGNVGMTPTSAAPGGLLPGLPGMNAEATPNVGRIKDRKALADADPLGVDMHVDFSKVGGLQGHIDQLKEMVQLPLLYPELFTRFHVTPPRGVLFHGPPGTGKTLLARALANSVGHGGRKISFYMRKGADALSKWVGEAEKQLRLLFEEARKTQPSIIFFDEIDGLAPVRSSKQEQIHASIVSTLLALMDGMDGRGQVIVIGATNRPDNIDPALRRPGRFDREFYFPLPDIDGRRSILNIHTKDWGMSDKFMTSLAEKTKGYGGADLRALCTEAALNAIQRSYPQIYSSTEKLLVDPNKIAVHASDFMMSIKKLIPSSERSATSGAQPLPKSVEPLLRSQFAQAKQLLDELLPLTKKKTALEEAMYEQENDKDHGFGREAMHQEFERSRVFRPRLLIHGTHGMGQTYLSSAILHHFEGVHVQNFDLPALLGDGRSMEQVIVGLFTEVRRHKPSVIYIPNIDAWYATLAGTMAFVTFQTMLRSIPPTDPVLVLATAECDNDEMPSNLVRDLFGFSRKNRMEIQRPEVENRYEYFNTTLSYIKMRPEDFPDREDRKRRVLEVLPVAPRIEPKPPTKEEIKAQKKKDHQHLNALKIQLQPIMDQINRKYRKFRQPVIPQSHIEYLFAESDPNYVRPDVTDGTQRPFEIVKDKHGHDVLRDTITGKTYYNLETTTIEERLSNGFYARPKDFLFDIRAMARDAKNIGDKERTLKANELLSNVEVDVAGIEASTAHIVDWEALHRRQLQRAAESAEKERKRRAMQSVLDRVQSDLGGGNDSDSQGPLTLGERVPGSTTTAHFQVRSPLSNGNGGGAQEPRAAGNDAEATAVAADGDVQMGGVEDSSQAVAQSSVMGPPAKVEDSARTGMTQMSQKSAVTALPPGVSPSAIVNDASTTKTSDPSTNRSSNWSSQLTNGNHPEQQSGDQNHNSGSNEGELPDTLEQPGQGTPSQAASSIPPWPHSQAHGLAQGNVAPGSILASSPISPQSQVRASSGGGGASGSDPVQPSPQDGSSARPSGSSSQPLAIERDVEILIQEASSKTSGFTIEQLEQVNREIMDELWKMRSEWNRGRVLNSVQRVFNDAVHDIEATQLLASSSQI